MVPEVGYFCDVPGHIVLGEGCKNIWNFELEKPASTHSMMGSPVESWKIQNVDNGGLAREVLEARNNSFRSIHVIYLRIYVLKKGS